MISNMFRTIFIRVLTAIISLLMIVFGGQFLGAAVLGEVSLILVAIAIINLAGGLAGGGALVYLMPRNPKLPLIMVSQVWALLSGVVTTLILWFLEAFPSGYFLHIALLGTAGSVLQNNLSIFLVHQRIKAHNFVSLLQSVILLSTFIVSITVCNMLNINAYLISLYVSYGIAMVVSLLMNLHSRNMHCTKQCFSVFRLLFGYGSLVQLSSVLALLTYRLTYYYTEAWLGLSALGFLSVAFQISESVWIIPRSIAMVQFSKVANLKNRNDAADLSWFLFAITIALTLCAVLVLYFLPDSLYSWIFGAEFMGIAPIVQAIIPGILAISAHTILSHFFSGTGLIKVNLATSAAGLLTVAVAGWLFIRNGSLLYAAITTSIGYFVIAFLSLLWFFVINRKHALSMRNGFHLFKHKSETV